jgi:hypothetical protein
MLARVTAAMTKPCICAAWSEVEEIEEEVRSSAREKAASAQQVYIGPLDPKLAEDKVRAEPDMQKRIAAAAGYYGVRYRVDKAYARVRVRWTELAGYARETGSFSGERALGEAGATGLRVPAQAGAQLTARTRLEPLRPGAYRIEIEGEAAGGGKVEIDRRVFWFDGHRFEEIQD